MRYLTRLSLSLLLLFLLLVGGKHVEAREIKVIDQANLFSSAERKKIEDQAYAFAEESNMDAIVVTTNDAEGKTAEAYADDYYDNSPYGFGSDKSGFLFLIDMDNRTYHISTTGKTIKLFTDQRIERMLDRAEGDMRDGDYAAAASSVLADAISYGRDVKYDNQTGRFKKIQRVTWIEGLIALIAAVVAGIVSFSSVYGTYNLKHSTYKYSYRDKGHLALKQKEDQLVNTATTSRYIPPSNSGGGGGSSTHTSSGGSSHGGGGRSF